MTDKQDASLHAQHAPAHTPEPDSPGEPALLSEDQMIAEQLEHEARREERDRLISEARWFVAAFALSVCLCFLIYAVL